MVRIIVVVWGLKVWYGGKGGDVLVSGKFSVLVFKVIVRIIVIRYI